MSALPPDRTQPSPLAPEEPEIEAVTEKGQPTSIPSFEIGPSTDTSTPSPIITPVNSTEQQLSITEPQQPKLWSDITLALEGFEFQCPASFAGQDEIKQEQTAQILYDLLKTECDFATFTSQNGLTKANSPDKTYTWRFSLYGNPNKVLSSVQRILEGFTTALWDYKSFAGNVYGIISFQDGTEELVQTEVGPNVRLDEAISKLVEETFNKTKTRNLPPVSEKILEQMPIQKADETFGRDNKDSMTPAEIETALSLLNWDRPIDQQPIECPECRGEKIVKLGDVEENLCPVCKGHGQILVTKTEEVDNYERLTLQNAGIKLFPMKSKMKGYIICKVCGEDFGDNLRGLEEYIRHIQSRHPQYVSQTKQEQMIENNSLCPKCEAVSSMEMEKDNDKTEWFCTACGYRTANMNEFFPKTEEGSGDAYCDFHAKFLVDHSETELDEDMKIAIDKAVYEEDVPDVDLEHIATCKNFPCERCNEIMKKSDFADILKDYERKPQLRLEEQDIHTCYTCGNEFERPVQWYGRENDKEKEFCSEECRDTYYEGDENDVNFEEGVSDNVYCVFHDLTLKNHTDEQLDEDAERQWFGQTPKDEDTPSRCPSSSCGADLTELLPEEIEWHLGGHQRWTPTGEEEKEEMKQPTAFYKGSPWGDFDPSQQFPDRRMADTGQPNLSEEGPTKCPQGHPHDCSQCDGYLVNVEQTHFCPKKINMLDGSQISGCNKEFKERKAEEDLPPCKYCANPKDAHPNPLCDEYAPDEDIRGEEKASLECSICGQKFWPYKEFQKHMFYAHNVLGNWADIYIKKEKQEDDPHEYEEDPDNTGFCYYCGKRKNNTLYHIQHKNEERIMMTCPTCKGVGGTEWGKDPTSGNKNVQYCRTCGGTGKVPKYKYEQEGEHTKDCQRRQAVLETIDVNHYNEPPNKTNDCSCLCHQKEQVVSDGGEVVDVETPEDKVPESEITQPVQAPSQQTYVSTLKRIEEGLTIINNRISTSGGTRPEDEKILQKFIDELNTILQDVSRGAKIDYEDLSKTKMLFDIAQSMIGYEVGGEYGKWVSEETDIRRALIEDYARLSQDLGDTRGEAEKDARNMSNPQLRQGVLELQELSEKQEESLLKNGIPCTHPSTERQTNGKTITCGVCGAYLGTVPAKDVGIYV